MDLLSLLLFWLYVAYIPLSFVALVLSSLIFFAMLKYRKARAVFSVFFLNRRKTAREMSFIFVLVILSILFEFVAIYTQYSWKLSAELASFVTYLSLFLVILGLTFVLYRWAKYTWRFVRF